MTNDITFRVSPIPESVARDARATRTDRSGNPVVAVRDGAPHQCRSCLRLSAPDETVLLLSHRPFDAEQPYAETGPIFVHERDCAPYDDPHVYPPEFPRERVVLRAYDAEDRIVGAQVVGDRPVERAVAETFAATGAVYLHARNLGYGCFMFRVDRA